MSTLTKLAAATAAAALCAAPAVVTAQGERAPWQVVIEQVVVLDAPATGDTATASRARRLELSALAWDDEARVLVAASDRGRLYRFQLGDAGTPMQPRLLSTRSLERSTTGARANIEGLAWRPGASTATAPAPAPAPTPAPAPAKATSTSSSELLLAEEFGSAVQRRTAEGEHLDSLPWPRAVADALASPAAGRTSHGVEAIAHHPRHGLLAALQRPQRLQAMPQTGASAGGDASARLAHWVHAADGTRWGFVTAGPRSQLKALEVMPDGSLLLLERVQTSRQAPLRAVLRRLDPQQCDGSRLCDAPALEQRPAALIGGDNFEGLACAPAPEGPCWLVSDDGGGSGRPTQLVQFRLVRP